MSITRPTSGQLAGVAVGFTVAGMVVGTALVLTRTYQSIGWLVFILSFGGWLPAALFALREAWHQGWFDR